jgi:hypothetical protein
MEALALRSAAPVVLAPRRAALEATWVLALHWVLVEMSALAQHWALGLVLRRRVREPVGELAWSQWWALVRARLQFCTSIFFRAKRKP